MKNNILEQYIYEAVKSLNKNPTLTERTSNNLTYGQLKKELNYFLKKKKMQKGGELAKAGMGLIPGIGEVTSWIDFVSALYKVKDKDRPESFLGDFDVDDDVSAIVDNDIESEFIKAVAEKIKSKPDNEKIGRFNMTDELKRYLSKRYNGRTVVGYNKNFKKK